MKKRRKLTPRRTKFVRELIKGASTSEAAKRAGYSPKNAKQSGYQALAQIQRTAPDLLAAHGLTDDVLIDKYLLPLMNANKRSPANWTARNNGLDKAFMIRGLYVKEQENKGPQFSVVIINAENRPDWSKMKRTNATPPENGHGQNGSNGSQ